jgi:hypothetical protein
MDRQSRNIRNYLFYLINLNFTFYGMNCASQYNER